MAAPSYKTHDPKGWCGDPKRGAAMGRPGHCATADFDGKLVLRHMRLDSGGYDCNGTYFGHGEPIYWYADENGQIDETLRAPNRAEAKKQILAYYPKAKLYR